MRCIEACFYAVRYYRWIKRRLALEQKSIQAKPNGIYFYLLSQPLWNQLPEESIA